MFLLKKTITYNNCGFFFNSVLTPRIKHASVPAPIEIFTPIYCQNLFRSSYFASNKSMGEADLSRLNMWDESEFIQLCNIMDSSNKQIKQRRVTAS